MNQNYLKNVYLLVYIDNIVLLLVNFQEFLPKLMNYFWCKLNYYDAI
ncbi:hypothetical protein SAMN06265377_1551 [Flagellimonas pacifica]|uniref:Uncharacterized protein n=1 Tax=Flagellimonas pacifica TaxID=1247520 RepID=A0A285MRI5_9FLAO|nr:hypothetical protein SAMN06265377_1551 [Allomuricauda parva]